MSGFEEILTPELTGIAVAILVMLAVGGIIYSVFQPSLSGTKRRDQRVQAVASRPQNESQRKQVRDTDRRKKSIQDQLKDFEERQKAKQDKQQKVSLKVRMEQAGLSWEMHHFIIFSVSLRCGCLCPRFYLATFNCADCCWRLPLPAAFGLPALVCGTQAQAPVCRVLWKNCRMASTSLSAG